MTKRGLLDLAYAAMEARLLSDEAVSSLAYADRVNPHEKATCDKLRTTANAAHADFRKAWEAQRAKDYAKRQAIARRRFQRDLAAGRRLDG